MNPTSDSHMSELLDLLVDRGVTPDDSLERCKVLCLALVKLADREMPRVPSIKVNLVLNSKVSPNIAFNLGRVVAAVDNMPTGLTPSKHRPQRIMWARDTFIHAIAGLSRALDGDLP